MTEFTAEEKNRLRDLMAGEDWELVMRVHADMLDRARSFCEEKPPAEVARWQGVALGLREFVKMLGEKSRQLSPLQEITSPTAHFKSSFGRSSAGGY